jgi:cytoskeletal protein CcmA (bactofilin family)
MHISGQIRADKDIIVHGHVEVSISLEEGLSIVSKQGQVDGDVKARVINIEGRVEGDLRATEQIIVRRSGQVRGSITAPRVALDFGCHFSGTVHMDASEDVQRDPKAPDRGEKITDIKSATSSSKVDSTSSVVGKGPPR